ncbi:MAG: PAS domain S-box protein [Nitrospiria bacterium]
MIKEEKTLFARMGMWGWAVLSGLYWLVESFFDSYLFHEGSFSARLLYPDPNEIWMRFLIISLILLFGTYAQATNKWKTSERKRREVSARFDEILEIALDAIVMIDEAYKVTHFNRGAEKVFGYDADEVLGRPVTLLMPMQFREMHERHIGAFSEGIETARMIGDRSCRIFGRRKNGEEFPAEASISKLQTSEGRVFTAILRDVTKRWED